MRIVPFASLVTLLAAGTAAAALVVSSSSFLGAPRGTPVAFTYVSLPPVDAFAPADPGPAVHLVQSAWTPSVEALLSGNTVITTNAQMRDVWKRLFSVPYDATQFDFDSEFVVLMGHEPLANASFDISAVDEVQASYAGDIGFGPGHSSEHFLSVTSTTFFSGVQPDDPPPASWRVSAVTIDRSQLDDVVFHRRVVMGI